MGAPPCLVLTPWRRNLYFTKKLLLLCIAIPAPGLFATPAAPFKSPPSPPLEKVVLQLKWWHQFQFAGYYAAIEKGFYKEVGLDVELRDGASPGLSVPDIVSRGEANFGVSNSSLLRDRAKGKPVVLLATIFQHSPLVLIARTDMTSITPAELAEHEIMMEPEDVELLSYFRSAGIAPSRLKVIRHSRDQRDLLNGKIAVMSAYVTDWIPSIKGNEPDVALISPRSAGIDFFGDNLFTSEEEIRQHPERVRLFREASLKGWEYALAHPDEIIALILAKYPTQRSREALLFEAHQIRQHIHPELIPLGTMNAQRWEKISEALEEAGLITNGRAALNGFLYDGFLEKNPHLLYWLSGSTGVLLLAALVWGLPLVRLNRRLRNEVSERHRAEEVASTALRAAEEASHTRNRFIATITHEIRTPLSIIVGYARTLANQEALPSEKENAIQAINESGQHLLKLIENTLDLSKVEAGREELSPSDFDLSLLLHSLNTIFQNACKEKGISFQLLWKPQGPVWVHGDEGKLRQVLFNLLGNAVKFTPDGKVILRVTPEKEERNYLFEVVDHGIGIDAADIRTIFEPFRQTEEGARFGGTGLGLPISFNLTQLMGSRLDVQSIKGKGSRFFFSVHLPPTHPPSPQAASPEKSEMPLVEGCKVKALVVDDVEMNRAILAHMLQTLGCDVKTAASGEEAIAFDRTEAFDIAFIDMRMQTMGGIETARRLRAQAGSRPIRLVCFSAAMIGDRKGDERAVGFDDFLAKPFRTERVRECLEALPNVRFADPCPATPPSPNRGWSPL